MLASLAGPGELFACDEHNSVCNPQVPWPLGTRIQSGGALFSTEVRG